jgi:hypothetical protein
MRRKNLLHLEMSKITVIFQDKKKNNCYIWGYGIQRHFQQYFSYIVAVSFIGGGNKTDLHLINKKLLKEAFNPINPPPPPQI